MKKEKKRNLEKISVITAMRSREWLLKAKDQILTCIHAIISQSNGLFIAPPKQLNYNYKYYLGTGNNSRIVERCFSNR